MSQKNGDKKKGRNAKWCQAYRMRGQREKNKAVRLLRHLLRFPEDGIAYGWLTNNGHADAAKVARARGEAKKAAKQKAA